MRDNFLCPTHFNNLKYLREFPGYLKLIRGPYSKQEILFKCDFLTQKLKEFQTLFCERIIMGHLSLWSMAKRSSTILNDQGETLLSFLR